MKDWFLYSMYLGIAIAVMSAGVALIERVAGIQFSQVIEAGIYLTVVFVFVRNLDAKLKAERAQEQAA